jgi:hypothetical protein
MYVTIVTSDYTASTLDELIVCETNSFTVAFPAATGSGRRLYVKNYNAGAITVAANGSDKIEGFSTQIINNPSCMLCCDITTGTWVII